MTRSKSLKDNKGTLPELLIPAGNLSKLRIALAYGADAVYVGAAGLSMRPDEASFAPEDLAEAVAETHEHNRKIYVGINAMLFQEDITVLKQWLEATKSILFDALIVSDLGAFSLIKELRPEINIHISTQMNTSNPAAASFWKKAGAERAILARECSLQQAKEIADTSKLEVEVFVHGAMCMAISGRCILSAYLCGHSASKGKCKHSCRWNWKLVEEKRPEMNFTAFETGRETIFLGAKDLCLIEHIPQLIESGVRSLKVEGRMKSEYYVATVTRVYRDALDHYFKDPLGYKFNPDWAKELEAVSHRPYSTGFAFGYPTQNPDSLQTDSVPISNCDILGIVTSISERDHTILVKNPFVPGETIEWIGPQMTGGSISIKDICEDKGKHLERAQPNTAIAVSFDNGIILPKHAILRRRKI